MFEVLFIVLTAVVFSELKSVYLNAMPAVTPKGYDLMARASVHCITRYICKTKICNTYSHTVIPLNWHKFAREDLIYCLFLGMAMHATTMCDKGKLSFATPPQYCVLR